MGGLLFLFIVFSIDFEFPTQKNIKHISQK